MWIYVDVYSHKILKVRNDEQDMLSTWHSLLISEHGVSEGFFCSLYETCFKLVRLLFPQRKAKTFNNKLEIKAKSEFHYTYVHEGYSVFCHLWGMSLYKI